MRINFEGENISYTSVGKGKPIVLLHGYLESSSVWEKLIEVFPCEYNFISIDLPGHGKSDDFGPVNTMEFMADAVKALFEDLNIEQASVFGHSMGGYVALAFAKKHPEKVLSVGLLHTVPFGDTPERAQKRKREVELVERGRKHLLCKGNIAYSFSPANFIVLKEEIDKATQVALETSDNGAKAALYGMMEREDFSEWISTTQTPVLWVIGLNDAMIPVDVYDMVTMSPVGEKTVLTKSGHMGMVEEPVLLAKIMEQFMQKHQDMTKTMKNNCQDVIFDT